MLPLRQQNLDREELFISKYGHLREQALKLADRNPNEAEDLLHDAFIHFTLSQTPVEEIQNLDGYLYIMLRNLRLSQVRRLSRTPQGNLSLIDYDSADAGLNSIDPRDRIKGQDELRAIAQYANVRKGSSKAAGVLILRFFHGYLPNEIASVLRSPRSAVDNLLQTARREARLFKTDPDALAFLHADKSSTSPHFSFGQVSTDILTEVRDALFQKREAECPRANIKEIYGVDDTNDKPVTAGFLAHIVVCRPCLDSVNATLGLPLLADRLVSDEAKPTDKKPRSGGGGSGSGSGGSMGGTSKDAFLKLSRTRRTQVFEHKPEELLISVNGFIIGSQRINSEVSELALSANLDEKIGFIEVFSERDVCLLFQSVEPPPDGAVVQPARVELSDGRVLELSLDFTETWPQLNASYKDPSFVEARSQETATAPIHVPFEDAMETTFIDRIRAFLQPMQIAVVATVLVAALAGFWFISQPTTVEPVSARAVLKQARDAEFRLAPTADKVLHRNYQVEVWANGELNSRRRVDEWQKQRSSARRTYDEQGRMIAGRWMGEDGKQQVFEQGERLKTIPKNSPPYEGGVAPASGDGVVLLLSPTANAFANLLDRHGVTNRTTVQESPTAYTFNFEDRNSETAQTGINERLIAATLTLDKNSYMPTSQTLVLQIGGEQREYRFSDVRVEQKPIADVPAAIFFPEPELSKGATVVTKPLEIELPTADLANKTTVITRENASLDTEVEVFRALDSVNALSGDQVTIERNAAGQVRVTGIVDTAQRKTEILNALSGLKNAPGLTINVQTAAEAASARKQTSGAITPIDLGDTQAITSSNLPVEDELKAHFERRGVTGEKLNEQITTYANGVLNRSDSLRRNALSLKRLAERFSPAELDRLDPARRDQWKALLRSKAAAVAGDARSLSSQLSAAGLGSGGDSPGAAIRDASGVAGAAQRLFGLGVECDAQVRQSFSISRGGPGSASVKTVQFWRNLRQIEAIAADIQKF